VNSRRVEWTKMEISRVVLEGERDSSDTVMLGGQSQQ
jgi:hypothetical protein